ncbi:MAG: hypothetical protein JWP01_3738 [Myxococcales bacterium]|nr:hypothetical protein [Myxococcales bacterium]
MRRFTLAALFVIACGPKPAPQKPTIDTRALAAELAAQMTEVAAIVHRHRTDCPKLASELRLLFVRMSASLDRAREAQQDPVVAKQLTTDMRAYDEASTNAVSSIEADFTVDSQCARDPQVRDVLQSMPTL